MKRACLLAQKTYRPGDLPPSDYLAWHEWARVQKAAGIRQYRCAECSRWITPQEASQHAHVKEAPHA